MNTKALTYGSGSFLIIAVAAALFASALLAHADTPPTLTTTIVNGSNAALTSAPIGTPVQASAVVASSSASTAPTGTVDFNLYNNQTCAGTPTVEAGVALVAGLAQSSTTTVPASGLSYLVDYNGDALNTPVAGSCVALTPTASNTTLTTALSTSTSVYAGSTINDTATLTNATADATGTVTYNIYTDSECSVLNQSAGTVTVGSALVPNSNSILFNTPGTYYWQAVYSGDQYNTAATSSCGSEVLTVIATTTPPVTAPGTISGEVYNDLNKNRTLDSGEPGLPGFTVWLHQGSGYNAPIIETTTTDANGNYSFVNLPLGTYFVEENVLSGYNQISSDTQVTLSITSDSATVNFANVAKSGTATSTNPGNGSGKGGSCTNMGSSGKSNNGYSKDNNQGSGNQGNDLKKDTNHTVSNNNVHQGWFAGLGNWIKGKHN